MGILSWFKGNSGGEPGGTSQVGYTQSSYMSAALARASKRPLDDNSFRVVLASPSRHYIFDVSIFQLDAALTAFESQGIDRMRRMAAVEIGRAVSSAQVEDEELLLGPVIAYFDRAYTLSANEGKTHETVWNTLLLDVKVVGKQLQATRAGCRIEYPVGPIELRFDPGRHFR